MLSVVRRPRRNRRSLMIRELIAETVLTKGDFICPLFLNDEQSTKKSIPSLPGVYQWSLDFLLQEIERLLLLGLRAIMIFPVVPLSVKDEIGSNALNENNVLCRGIRTIKQLFPEICVISDIALDPYTTHGHDGIVRNGEIVNDESVEIFGKMALLHAQSGVDIVAPSDMMDGRVGYIRSVLDRHGYAHVAILSYSVKYASSLYAPFRYVLSSHTVGDKFSYQMDIRNSNEALLECSLDTEEGADILMVKPAGMYLDVIYRVKMQTCLPLAAYQVSGEYAMIVNAAANGILNWQNLLMESLIAIKRAGADMIISYATPLLLETNLFSCSS